MLRETQIVFQKKKKHKEFLYRYFTQVVAIAYFTKLSTLIAQNKKITTTSVTDFRRHTVKVRYGNSAIDRTSFISRKISQYVCTATI